MNVDARLLEAPNRSYAPGGTRACFTTRGANLSGDAEQDPCSVKIVHFIGEPKPWAGEAARRGRTIGIARAARGLWRERCAAFMPGAP